MLQAVGVDEIDKLQNSFPALFDAIQEKDKDEIFVKQQELLNYVGNIEEAMVKAFPFEVPSEYSYLPQLKVWTSCKAEII